MDYPTYCPLRLFANPYIRNSLCDDFHSKLILSHTSAKDFGCQIENDGGIFKINLDVQHYQPEEISVKVSDKEIVIEGKHEERRDEIGYISRQFKRRFDLPSKFSPDNIVSSLSADGILTVKAEKASDFKERIVPIRITGSNETYNSNFSTGVTQKDIDDAIREANELINRDRANIVSGIIHAPGRGESSFAKDTLDTNFESVRYKDLQDIETGKMQSEFDLPCTSQTSKLCSISESETMIKNMSSFKSTSSKTQSEKLSEIINEEIRDATEEL